MLGEAGLDGPAARRSTGLCPRGWKQRLALGCAVLHEPPILFLDEPTSGVDPIARRGFWDLIYALAGRGTTVFVTTHYMEEAEYCHRLALMNRGKLIALDTPAAPARGAPRAAPRGARRATARGRWKRCRSAGRRPGRPLRPRRPRHPQEGEDAGRDRERLRRAPGRERGIEVESIEPIAPSLEDVFIALVERAGGAVVD